MTGRIQERPPPPPQEAPSLCGSYFSVLRTRSAGTGQPAWQPWLQGGRPRAAWDPRPCSALPYARWRFCRSLQPLPIPVGAPWTMCVPTVLPASHPPTISVTGMVTLRKPESHKLHLSPGLCPDTAAEPLILPMASFRPSGPALTFGPFQPTAAPLTSPQGGRQAPCRWHMQSKPEAAGSRPREGSQGQAGPSWWDTCPTGREGLSCR